jgi:hypothetical protein
MVENIPLAENQGSGNTPFLPGLQLERDGENAPVVG